MNQAIPTALLRERGSTLAVYCAYARHADYETGECWPSTARIAELCGVDERTVKRCRTHLCELGYMTKGTRRGAWVLHGDSETGGHQCHHKGTSMSPKGDTGVTFTSEPDDASGTSMSPSKGHPCHPEHYQEPKTQNPLYPLAKNQAEQDQDSDPRPEQAERVMPKPRPQPKPGRLIALPKPRPAQPDRTPATQPKPQRAASAEPVIGKGNPPSGPQGSLDGYFAANAEGEMLGELAREICQHYPNAHSRMVPRVRDLLERLSSDDRELARTAAREMGQLIDAAPHQLRFTPKVQNFLDPTHEHGFAEPSAQRRARLEKHDERSKTSRRVVTASDPDANAQLGYEGALRAVPKRRNA